MERNTIRRQTFGMMNICKEERYLMKVSTNTRTMNNKTCVIKVIVIKKTTKTEVSIITIKVINLMPSNLTITTMHLNKKILVTIQLLTTSSTTLNRTSILTNTKSSRKVKDKLCL